MLLPSALDCAPSMQPIRSVYSASRERLPPAHKRSHSSTAPAFNTCRALQSLLASNLAPLAPVNGNRAAPPSLASPIDFDHTKSPLKKKPARRPQQHPAPTIAPSSNTPPPASRKRRRSDSESDEPSTSTSSTLPKLPSTPKRQRLHPPTLPLGLSPSDFTALQDEAASIPLPCTPTTSTSTTLTTTHPSPDSAALVSLILHKLRLRQSDWDELGRGGDSIGGRFRLLLDEKSGLAFRRGGGRGLGRRRGLREVGFGGEVV